MKTLASLAAIFTLAAGLPAALMAAAEPPAVYDQENSGVDLQGMHFTDFDSLPEVATLPDPFMWADGSGRSTDFADWERHRGETLQQLWHYEIGEKPAVSRDSIEASLVGDTLVVTVHEGGATLTLRSAIVYPEGPGPFPAVIGIGFPTGSLPQDLFIDNGVAAIPFSFWEVMGHTQTRGEEPINRLYPDQTDMGAYTAWPWGISRLIDALEIVADSSRIDLRHIGVTGCSFAGKMALFAGAMDERIALTIAQEPGGGGVNSWRVAETLGNVETIGRTNYAWFKESMRRFAEENASRLPIDHHQLAALVAPRALLVLGNTDYEWLADEAGYVSCMAARNVWKEFGVESRMGFSIEGGHGHCMLPDGQRPEVEAFVKRFLLGDEAVDTNVTRADMFKDVDWRKWAPWIK